MLVGTLDGLTQAKPGMKPAEADLYDIPAQADSDVATHGIEPEMHQALAATWAWLQHYTTQMYVNFRDLYPRVAAGTALPDDSYLGKLYATTARCFDLGPGEFATIAGIVDRLDDLNTWAGGKHPFYYAGPMPPVDKRFFPIQLHEGLPTNLREVMRWQLWIMVQCAGTIQPALKPCYRVSSPKSCR